MTAFTEHWLILHQCASQFIKWAPTFRQNEKGIVTVGECGLYYILQQGKPLKYWLVFSFFFNQQLLSTMARVSLNPILSSFWTSAGCLHLVFMSLVVTCMLLSIKATNAVSECARTQQKQIACFAVWPRLGNKQHWHRQCCTDPNGDTVSTFSMLSLVG